MDQRVQALPEAAQIHSRRGRDLLHNDEDVRLDQQLAIRHGHLDHARTAAAATERSPGLQPKRGAKRPI